nr:recombinase family protein [uncultured Peptostreptococcus sp.]
MGISYSAKAPVGQYAWQSRTIANILCHPEYLGHTVNYKTFKKSYKTKKKLWNDPYKWQVFENTHKAIIDQETFDIVQRIRDGRRRRTPMGKCLFFPRYCIVSIVVRNFIR